jgi:hypothetical protein
LDEQRDRPREQRDEREQQAVDDDASDEHRHEPGHVVTNQPVHERRHREHEIDAEEDRRHEALNLLQQHEADHREHDDRNRRECARPAAHAVGALPRLLVHPCPSLQQVPREFTPRK